MSTSTSTQDAASPSSGSRVAARPPLPASCLRLEDATAGSITLNGLDITSLDEKQMRPLRRQVQMVFQDPYSSLNPHLSVGEIIAEPLIVQKIPDRRNRVQALLSSVNLDPRCKRALRDGVLGRPAPADRHRPGTGARAEHDRPR